MNYLEKFSLKGKIAAITGGGGLIGLEIARAMLELGAKVFVLDIKECNLQGAEYLPLDISNISELKKNIERIFNDNKFDIFINSAYPRTSDWNSKLESISYSSWQKNIDMHLNSYCLATKYVAELMVTNSIKGSIINISSIYGIAAPDFAIYEGTTMTSPAAYSAIKAGIINFTRYIASYYGNKGIRANSICPGGVYHNQDKRFVSNYNKKVPLGRMATTQDIASVAAFLASDASSYISGAALPVDGGLTII